MRVGLGRDDLPEGGWRGLEVAGGKRVLLARLAGGLFALDDTCNHSGCLLSQGRIAGGLVRCPCHAMEFDVRTGALASLPRLCDDQRTYPVTLEGGEVFVEITD